MGGRPPEKLWKTGEGPSGMLAQALTPHPHFLQPVGVSVGAQEARGSGPNLTRALAFCFPLQVPRA